MRLAVNIRRHHTIKMPVLNAQRLLTLSKTPSLAGSWYYIAAAAFAICNKPDEIPKIFHMALSQRPEGMNAVDVAEKAINQAALMLLLQKLGPVPDTLESLKQHSSDVNVQFVSSDNQLVIAKKTREALLKGAALGGLPKAINALTLLRNATPNTLRETEKLRNNSGLTFQQEKRRGSEFWDTVYGKVSRRVKGQMDTAYPDLLAWTMDHVYSPLLSYTGVLSAKESSLVVISCLVPQDVNPQLKGHLRGAANNGASLEEIRAARDMAIQIAGWCDIQLKEEVAKL